MIVKNGVYCSMQKKETEEVHGGVTLQDSYYHHICFYFPENLVGFYGGGRLWFAPYSRRNFRYSGEIGKVENNQIEFSIIDPYNNDKIHFTGIEEGDQLQIKAVRNSEPDKIWLEGTFEYIGTGE